MKTYSTDTLLAVLYITISSFVFGILPVHLQAQDVGRTILLQDADTRLPIPFAHVACDQFQGISGEDGQLLLPADRCDDLWLSHLEYGQRVVHATELDQLLQDGILTWKRDPGVILQPVTVLALRQGNRPQTRQQFTDQDWLAHDAGDVLTRDPGIAVIRKAGQYGFDPVVRGMKYDQLNLVIDGAQSCVAACPNRMDPPASQVSLNQMEKVEVIKGPHALRYGSGLGGTLLFTSAPAGFSDQLGGHSRLSTGYETNGDLFRTEGLVGFTHRAIALDLNGSWSQGGDYTDGNGQSIASGFNRGSFGTNARFRINETNTLQANVTRNLARDVEFASLGMDLRRDDTWMTNLRHEWHGGGQGLNRWTTMVSGSFVDHLMDNLLKPLDPRMMNMSTAARTQTYGARTEATFLLGRHLLYAGADLRQEKASGDRTREFLMGPMAGKTAIDAVWQDSRITNTGIFAEYHHDLGRYRLIASGRVGLNQATALDPAATFLEEYPDPDVMQINPSVSLGMIRTWAKGWTTSLWIAQSQRSAGLIERYIHYLPVGLDPYEMLGNPDLKPEINRQVDLNIQYDYAGGRLQLTAFGSLLQDFISGQKRPDLAPRIPSAPGVRQFINLSEALMAGGEASWIQAWPASLQSEIHVAWVYGEDRDRDQPLAEIPPLDARISVWGSWWHDRITPRVTWRQVLAQERVSSEFGEPTTAGFGLLDMQVGIRILPVLKVSVGGQNLLDEAYAEHLSRAMTGVMPSTRLLAPGRNIYVTASFDLGR
ncbi:MAG: TonB-dependent receptor [Lewinellaceae bacterium]|nr:TonB-dependent receptor [Saprospiraceae bacterium]MCB9312562.1 TonB-dependent receptor [Lewinellaceae bacterium]HRW75354.1 TonB-dependent receptor [Saprospiraceae bacterium]